MNDFLSKENLDALINAEGASLVSLYMPAHHLPNEATQDPIRLRNLLNEAQQQLKTQGVRTPEIRKLLKPADDLINNSQFWRHQSDGLALFLRPGEFYSWRLPLNFRELAVVGERWHIKPLLPLFAGDGRFYILALSQKAVRLLEGTRHRVAEITLEAMPTSLAEALRFDDPERQLQFHTSSAPPGGGRRPAIFYGSGGLEDRSKSDLLRYFRSIDDGLHEILHDQRSPLVLAGVDYLLPIYREANRYDRLVVDGVTGNPDDLRPEALHEAAWPLVEPIFNAQREEAQARYQALTANDLAINDLPRILAYTHQGRVDTIFVPLGQRQWGIYDPVSDRVTLYANQQPGARDLLDLAAVQTYLNSGVVYAVDPAEMPNGAPIAAILRY